MLGGDSDELKGGPFSDFVHPDDLASTAVEFDLVVNELEAVRTSFVNRHRCRIGDYR